MKHLYLGIIILFITCISHLSAQTLTDVDGNTYRTVVLGKQTWMKENLKVAHYRNGDAIASTHDTLAICYQNEPKYQWPFGGNEKLVNMYGRLYTWHVVTDSRQVCPSGWHLPTPGEWIELQKFLCLDTFKLENTNSQAYADIISNMVSDYKPSQPNGGMRGCGGAYLQTSLSWWCKSTNSELSNIWDLGPLFGHRIKSFHEENNGLPVRCIKD